jgi:hypothetical protein
MLRPFFYILTGFILLNCSSTGTSDSLQFPFDDYDYSINSLELGVALQLYGSTIAYIQLGNEWNWELDEYFYGNDELYIRLSNILFVVLEAMTIENPPRVLLGSLSIGGLRAVAFASGSLDNVTFPKGDLYSQEDISRADALASTMIPRMEEILGQVNYHGVDLHLYDDYWNWPIYMEELQNLSNQTGKDTQEYFYVASEFGGPHPELEDDTQAFRAIRVNEYVHALDHLPLQWALFFKLVEDPGPGVAHPNSFLLDQELRETLSYEMLRRFVE